MLEDKVEALSSRAAGQYPRGLLQAIDAGLAVRPENSNIPLRGQCRRLRQ